MFLMSFCFHVMTFLWTLDNVLLGYLHNIWKGTLLKTNIALANRPSQKERIVFQPSIFQGLLLLVSGRVPWCDLCNRKFKEPQTPFWCKPSTSPGYVLIDAQIPIEYVSRLAMNQLVSGGSRWIFTMGFSPQTTIDVWRILKKAFWRPNEICI